jgi:hypothetical protein
VLVRCAGIRRACGQVDHVAVADVSSLRPCCCCGAIAACLSEGKHGCLLGSTRRAGWSNHGHLSAPFLRHDREDARLSACISRPAQDGPRNRRGTMAKNRGSKRERVGRGRRLRPVVSKPLHS